MLRRQIQGQQLRPSYAAVDPSIPSRPLSRMQVLSILILVWSGGLGARVATAAAAPTGQIQRRGRSGSSVLASANSRVKRASVARGRAIMLWVGEHELHHGRRGGALWPGPRGLLPESGRISTRPRAAQAPGPCQMASEGCRAVAGPPPGR